MDTKKILIVIAIVLGLVVVIASISLMGEEFDPVDYKPEKLEPVTDNDFDLDFDFDGEDEEEVEEEDTDTEEEVEEEEPVEEE